MAPVLVMQFGLGEIVVRITSFRFHTKKVAKMKTLYNSTLVTCLLFSNGCWSSKVDTKESTQVTTLVSQVVEASCGECQFKMDGKGCDLAVRIDSKSYYVDGAKLDDHGDAHSHDGMCNAIRKAKVTGEIKNGRFVASAFELLSE